MTVHIQNMFTFIIIMMIILFSKDGRSELCRGHHSGNFGFCVPTSDSTTLDLCSYNDYAIEPTGDCPSAVRPILSDIVAYDQYRIFVVSPYRLMVVMVGNPIRVSLGKVLDFALTMKILIKLRCVKPSSSLMTIKITFVEIL